MWFSLAPLPDQAARPGRTIAAADYRPTAPRNHGSFPLTTCEQSCIETSDRMFLESCLLLPTHEFFNPDHTAFTFAPELWLSVLTQCFKLRMTNSFSTPLVRNNSSIVVNSPRKAR